VNSKELRKLILKLPKDSVHAEKMEKAIGLRARGRRAWYKTQKEHWLGWLAERDGTGFYGRKTWGHDAEYIYDHIQCAPMLLWLAEALGVSEAKIRKASKAVIAAGRNYARQCAALRREIPWQVIACAIHEKDHFKDSRA